LKITIQYFAKLREERGCSSENYQTDSQTALELYYELQKKYNFTIPLESLKVAVNDDFSDWNTLLKDNDSIVFIQPVAGG
jgi:molybdopterin converting factor small subunit